MTGGRCVRGLASSRTKLLLKVVVANGIRAGGLPTSADKRQVGIKVRVVSRSTRTITDQASSPQFIITGFWTQCVNASKALKIQKKFNFKPPDFQFVFKFWTQTILKKLWKFFQIQVQLIFFQIKQTQLKLIKLWKLNNRSIFKPRISKIFDNFMQIFYSSANQITN